MTRISYAGQPGTDRAAAFVALLEQHFGQVSVSSVEQLDTIDLRATDVLVVDGEGVNNPPAIPLDLELFPVPTVLIGALGGTVGDRLGLKLGWRYGCVCLGHQAIITPSDQQHPIFSGPVAVPSFEPVMGIGSESFQNYAAVKDVPDDFPLVAIHDDFSLPQDVFKARIEELRAEGDVQALQSYVRSQPTPGLVTTSAGFFDSPDCESILGGVNSKAHDYVAVGRQGRFLQWGFHNDPSSMTDVGRALFVNGVSYISGFADAPVEARRVQQPREMLQVSLAFGGFERALKEPAPENPLAWFDTHRGYLRQVGVQPLDSWLIDSDLQVLGLANDDPALLPALAGNLDAPGDLGSRARLLWQRYVHRDPTDAATERAWLADHEKDLFFSDWAGYRWMSRRDLPVLEPALREFTGNSEVKGRIAAHRGADGTVQAVLTLMVTPGSYVYGDLATDGMPLTLEVSGDWELAQMALPDGHVEGNHYLPFSVTGDGTELTVALGFRACDAQQCHLPSTLELTCPVTTEL